MITEILNFLSSTVFITLATLLVCAFASHHVWLSPIFPRRSLMYRTSSFVLIIYMAYNVFAMLVTFKNSVTLDGKPQYLLVQAMIFPAWIVATLALLAMTFLIRHVKSQNNNPPYGFMPMNFGKVEYGRSEYPASTESVRINPMVAADNTQLAEIFYKSIDALGPVNVPEAVGVEIIRGTLDLYRLHIGTAEPTIGSYIDFINTSDIDIIRVAKISLLQKSE